jgi:hypothetical protein
VTRLVPDTHAYTHDGQRRVPRDRPDIRAQLTGSFTYVDQRFMKEWRVCFDHSQGSAIAALRSARPADSAYVHCTRDASRDIKPGCQDHHPAAIGLRPPLSDPRPTERGARPLLKPRRRSRWRLSRRYRRPADRRSRPEQWADAAQTLADLLDQFQEWRDKLPFGLANSATAEALDAVLELRGHVDDLQAVELPKGFGRD